MRITLLNILIGIVTMVGLVLFIYGLTATPPRHPTHMKILDTVGYNTDRYYHTYSLTFEDENGNICAHKYTQDEIRMIPNKVVLGDTINKVFKAHETFNKETGELLTRTKSPTEPVTKQQGLY